MAAPAPETPKLDLKMMVFPVMFMLQKQIDMKNPEIVRYAQIGMITMATIALSAYFFIKLAIDSKNDTTKIWVPPKPPPSIPFVTPPAEPLKPEDFTQTTYQEHEKKVLMEALQGIAMSCGIAAVMSFKFDIHVSCFMQTVMVPLGLFENILFQKYILGQIKERAYNELDHAPTGTQPANQIHDEDEDEDDSIPRVEELDEPTVAAPISTTSSSNAAPKEETPVSDDDDTVKVEKSDVHEID